MTQTPPDHTADDLEARRALHGRRWLFLPVSPMTAAWLLRAAILATGAGMALRVFHGNDFTGINSYLFLNWEWSHEAASHAERIAVAAMALLAIVAFVRPWALVLAAFSGLILMEAAVRQTVGGYAFSEWTVYSESIRYLAPVALILIAARSLRDRPRSWTVAAWMLRVSIASVFFSHGWAAWHQNPVFIDMLIASADNLLGMRLRQANATVMLTWIGAMDMTVAALVLVAPWKIVLRWAAAWGLITAASRIPSFGWQAYGEFMVRASHALAPLALGYLILSIRRSAGHPTVSRDRAFGYDGPAEKNHEPIRPSWPTDHQPRPGL